MSGVFECVRALSAACRNVWRACRVVFESRVARVLARANIADASQRALVRTKMNQGSAADHDSYIGVPRCIAQRCFVRLCPRARKPNLKQIERKRASSRLVR